MEVPVINKFLFVFHPHRKIILDSGEIPALLANCTVIMLQGGGYINLTIHSPILAWDQLYPKLVQSVDGYFAIPGEIKFSSPETNTLRITFDIPKYDAFEIGWWLFAKALRIWGIKQQLSFISMPWPQTAVRTHSVEHYSSVRPRFN